MGLGLAGFPSVEGNPADPKDLGHLILPKAGCSAKLRPHMRWRQDVRLRKQSVDCIK